MRLSERWRKMKDERRKSRPGEVKEMVKGGEEVKGVERQWSGLVL